MKKYINQNINNERILIESEEDLELKNKINKIFGEDYASLIFNSNINIEKSINLFTSKFYNINSIHIQSLLFQSAIISKNNKLHTIFNKRLNHDECFMLFQRIKNDMYLRKILTREFIKDSNKTNIDLYNSINNDGEKERIIHNINVIKQYEKGFILQTTHRKNNRYL